MRIANSISAAADIAEEISRSRGSLPSWAIDRDVPLQSISKITFKAIDRYLRYKKSDGSVTGIGWWQIANGYTAMALVELCYGITANRDLLTGAIWRCERRQPGFINEFNDDTCWWALLCVHVYSYKGDDRFLRKAEYIWQHIRDDGSVCPKGKVFFRGADMEGAVYWKARTSETKNDHINAISTGLYAELSARLALIHLRRESDTQDQYQADGRSAQEYIDTARCCLGWILKHRYRPVQGVVLDRLELDEERAVDWTFTYNTGVALGTCALLFEATGEDDYMILACHMARQSMLRPGWVEDNGVLTEKGAFGRGTHDPLKPNDAIGFKSVLIRHLGTLYDVISRTQCQTSQAQQVKSMIRKFIQINVQYQQSRNTRRGEYGPWWNGPFEYPTSHSQMAVLDVFAAASLVDRETRSVSMTAATPYRAC